MKNPESYSEALKELEEIVDQLETDDIAVDELLDKVKRSSELLHFCQDKLTKTEEEVKAVLQEMPQAGETPENGELPEENIVGQEDNNQQEEDFSAQDTPETNDGDDNREQSL